MAAFNESLWTHHRLVNISVFENTFKFFPSYFVFFKPWTLYAPLVCIELIKMNQIISKSVNDWNSASSSQEGRLITSCCRLFQHFSRSTCTILNLQILNFGNWCNSNDHVVFVESTLIKVSSNKSEWNNPVTRHGELEGETGTEET